MLGEELDEPPQSTVCEDSFDVSVVDGDEVPVACSMATRSSLRPHFRVVTSTTRKDSDQWSHPVCSRLAARTPNLPNGVYV
jgi:hypothetical protein